MNTAKRRFIVDPFVVRHRVTGPLLVLLGLVVLGAVVGAAIGSVIVQVVELLLLLVNGGS